MDPASVSLAAAWAGLCAGALHGWIFVQHRAARAHLWIAASALGMGVVSYAGARLYGPLGPAEVELLERLRLAGAALILLGFLRFTACHLELALGAALRAADALAAGIAALAALAPHGLLVSGVELVRIPALDLAYHQGRFAPTGLGVVAALLAESLAVAGLWVRGAWRGQAAARPLLPLLAVSLAAGVSDAAVGLGLYRAPNLLAGGYLPLVLGLSVLLTRRLARSGADVERLARSLQRRAEQRAQELRARDLQLARGEQLAALGTLAAGIAHEINNPLAYVSANLNHLEELWEKQEDLDETDEILADCREGIERVRTIASGLVRMARRGDTRFEAVDVPEVVRSVLPMLRLEARGRVEIVERLEPVPPVHGNAHLLGQVVLNVALNAIQAVPPGDPSGHRVEIAASARAGQVELVVSDTGGGIPESLLLRIFEPFFTTKQSGEGTGLGLAVTRQIVTRHQGQIRVESGPDGTRVTVNLPASDPTPEPGHAAG